MLSPMNLPLHPLFVHLPVVLFPLAAIAGIVHVVVKRWRGHLLWPTAVAALVAFLATLVARTTGEDLAQRFPGEAAQVAVHEQYSSLLVAAGSVFGLGILLALLTRPGTGFGPRLKPGWVALLGHVLMVLGGLAVLVTIVLTGDSGARMVWGG
ncbi:hypothetical protein AESSP_02380 [Aestuariimicrobium sp. T2.26MG-19.2B]|nr:hypothetical protein AESSP_02380 [Aestuariimicrobium sp. T2.26MG-19.2B]